jgi:hypothetical protein
MATRTAVFKSVSGINCAMGVKPSPVRALEPHIEFFTHVLGLALAKRDQQSAVLKAVVHSSRATAPK